MSLGDENLLYPSHSSTENIEETVEAVHIPFIHTDGIDPSNSAENTADYDTGGNFIVAMQEVPNMSARDLEQSSTQGPLNETLQGHWTSNEEIPLEGENLIVWYPSRDPVANSSDGTSFDSWLAQGMSADEHMSLLLEINNLDMSQPLPRKGEDELIERPEQSNTEE
ncbi:hypothetical protein E8E14_011464 [Neopestalotiopsis sp. 37M]|nr:hypothetical protein E8E14_011464 [Neopestalotiopsis sp. 37M]